MTLSLIQALAPSILVLSFVLPAVTGFLGKSVEKSLGLGWCLFVLSFLFQDLFSVMLASHFLGQEAVRSVAADQPGTTAAIFVGFLTALISHFLGRGLRKLADRFRRAGNTTHRI